METTVTCAYCGAATQLFKADVPVCKNCDDAHEKVNPVRWNLDPRGRRGDKGRRRRKGSECVSNFLEDFTSANRARVEFILTDLNLAIAFLDVAGPPPIRMWFAEIMTTHGKHTLPLRTFWES